MGACGAQGVLGGDNREGPGQGVAHAVHSDLALLHGFQQGALGFGAGAVDLIGQKEVAQGRAGPVGKAPRVPVPHREAHHVGGHHLGGELHPVVLQAHSFGKGQGQGGFSHAGVVLQQDVPPGQNGHEHLADHSVLSQNGFTHLADDSQGLGL